MSTLLTSADGRPLDVQELEEKGIQLTERILELVEETFNIELGHPTESSSDVHTYIDQVVKTAIEEAYDIYLDQEKIIKE